MAKKVMALVMAIALVVCFAVSASAIGVITTTTYYNGEADVAVNVTVTGINAGDNVTYYATKGGADVFVDQAKATASGAEFSFYTAATNLESAVKVGYTGSDVAENAVIEGYTVTYPAGAKVIPTEATTVTFPYTLAEGKVIAAEAVTVTAGTAVVASASYAAGNVTVIFTSIASDVTLAVNVEDAQPETPTATAEEIESAAIVSTGKLDGNIVNNESEFNPEINAAEGERKLTVIGKVTAAAEYGILVSESAIEDAVVTTAKFQADYAAKAYAGATKDEATGVFAVQLIDTSIDGALIKAGKAYHTAVYVKDANGTYVIAAGSAVTAN